MDLSLPAVQLRQLREVVSRISDLRDSQAELVSSGDRADIYQMGLYNGLEIALSMLTNRKPTLCVMKCCATCSNCIENMCSVFSQPVDNSNNCDFWRE